MATWCILLALNTPGFTQPQRRRKIQRRAGCQRGAKGSVQFPLDKPIPYDLIRRITLFRVQESLANANQNEKAGIILPSGYHRDLFQI
jgi:uncharacterized protein YdhG (YjbR/CyaY superfamily)